MPPSCSRATPPRPVPRRALAKPAPAVVKPQLERSAAALPFAGAENAANHHAVSLKPQNSAYSISIHQPRHCCAEIGLRAVFYTLQGGCAPWGTIAAWLDHAAALG